jgi:hypothetical protein
MLNSGATGEAAKHIGAQGGDDGEDVHGGLGSC